MSKLNVTNETTDFENLEQEIKKNKFERLLLNIFKHNNRFKFVGIEIFLDNPNPFMLLSRTREKNVHVKYEDSYLIISRNDRYKTRIITIPLQAISELNIKIISNNEYVVDFMINNINYSMVIEVL